MTALQATRSTMLSASCHTITHPHIRPDVRVETTRPATAYCVSVTRHICGKSRVNASIACSAARPAVSLHALKSSGWQHDLDPAPTLAVSCVPDVTRGPHKSKPASTMSADCSAATDDSQHVDTCATPRQLILTSQTSSVLAFSSTTLAAAPTLSVTYMPNMLYSSTANVLTPRAPAGTPRTTSHWGVNSNPIAWHEL